MTASKAYAWSIVVAAFAVLLGLSAAYDVGSSISLYSFLFWTALLAAVELLPVYLGTRAELTMGFVIILPVVILYPPPIAMLIVGLGAVDPLELRLKLPPHKALFNRAQSMLAVAAATMPFSIFDLPRFSFVAIVLAAGIHLMTNLGLVATAVKFERGMSLRDVLANLLPSPISGFAITYALLTGLGAATALVYSRTEGAGWAVAAILIPLLFARISIIGARNQHELSERLRAQQDALLQVTDRIFKERESERKRIAADIHDSSLQLLAAATYACGNAKDALARGDT
ncbi:MAG: hypothetical protein M3161_06305, partial [Actinomycetota bacterium]|nr:hypothetical protein [Actinomycetota bacterium]